jgi:hypothetical protein
MFWEGMVEEELVKADVQAGSGESGAPEIRGRTVDTGAGVINLAAMRDELAAAR